MYQIKYVLVYRLKPKLNSNTVQTILANTWINEQLQLNIQGNAATDFKGVVVSFTPTSCTVHLGIQQWKNYLNLSIFAKVILKIEVVRFYGSRCMLLRVKPTDWDLYFWKKEGHPLFFDSILFFISCLYEI